MLVVGLSGQVGEALLPLLLAREPAIHALSRGARQDAEQLRWLRGSLEAMPALPEQIQTIVSLGPLDAFARWLTAGQWHGARIVALGSTGRVDKANSADAGERDLALRLQDAEDVLFNTTESRSIAATLLRPTLLYGNGRDQTVSRLVEAARRSPVVVLPSHALGLRQPVHVGDVAEAVIRCLDVPGTAGKAYDLPGGETLSFLDLARRSINAHVPGKPVLAVPSFVFDGALALLRIAGRAPAGLGSLARLRQDQVADGSPARRDFGFHPRPFQP